MKQKRRISRTDLADELDLLCCAADGARLLAEAAGRDERAMSEPCMAIAAVLKLVVEKLRRRVTGMLEEEAAKMGEAR